VRWAAHGSGGLKSLWRSDEGRHISKSGGNASLAGYKITGGQGVHREVESGGLAENCRAVVEGAIPLTNRSAKGGARSSLHYGGEGASHPPTAPRCVRTARQGRSVRDPEENSCGSRWLRDKRPYKWKAKWEAMPYE